MHTELLLNIGLSIVAGTILAYLARLARQPLLLGYIAAGVLIGPIGLGLVKGEEGGKAIGELAELGLAFLMFIVGLEIDIKKLLSMGKQATIMTVVQVAGGVALGWLAGWLLGYRGLAAVYIGAMVSLSSTMIVVKLLSDRGELDTLPGRVTLGVMLMQDVAAVVMLAIQPNLGGEGGFPALAMALAAVKGLALVAAAIAVSRFVLPLLFRWVAMVPEILLLSAVTWCFVVCYGAIVLGFSSAMGALIAGVSIAAYPYSLDVVAKIRALRDFFVTLFFVSLGMLLTVPTWKTLGAAGVLAVVVLLSRLATVWPVARWLKYDNRVGVLSSLHLAQISEFALVLVMLGGPTKLKHVDQEMVSLAVILMIVTSTATTYLIQYSHRIAALVVGGAGRTPLRDELSSRSHDQHPAPAPVMLVGCFRIGSSLVHELKQAGREFSVIDFNPKVRAELSKLGVPCIYGDISHLDTLEHAGAQQAKVLVASVPDDFLRGTDNARLLAGLKRLNPTARVIVVAESIRHAVDLYQQGADYVILPRVFAAQGVVDAMTRMDDSRFDQWRQDTIASLRQRVEVIP